VEQALLNPRGIVWSRATSTIPRTVFAVLVLVFGDRSQATISIEVLDDPDP
jgi:hypothetical protein